MKIIDDYCNKKSMELAKEIGDYALFVFKTPDWILKRIFLAKLYAKIFGLRIEVQKNVADLSTDYRFFRRNKKVGEKKIKDINLI